MAADDLRSHLQPLDDTERDHRGVLDLVGDAQLVLLGEASHGTHDFYHERAEITKRLIIEKGFTAVAVEADWPDAYRVNRYVQCDSDDSDADSALEGFERFPTWMWRNTVVLEFVEWLRDLNASRSDKNRTGFYGLDLYSLFNSMDAVIKYLERVDPEAARRARYRYSCFEHFGEDSQAYGYVASFDLERSCEDEAINQLLDVQRRAMEYLGASRRDDFFDAEQNARLVKNAEEYYRSMFRGRQSSWNLRDTHMAETVDALIAYLRRHQRQPKIVLWAHNSHLGDARATEMGARGELNVGQLIRQKFGDAARLVGFTTYSGTVTAANDWDEPGERKRVRPSLPESYELGFHDTGVPRFFLSLRDGAATSSLLSRQRLERAIGVIYRPQTERISHYFRADLPRQFDAVFHFDETRALQPLELPERWHEVEPPETYPSGL
ncbi:MAG TPA: erythromycin esterase family protein [Gemmatimonadaceae bacterium]|nr:erythromycin esterase family protein [Gemmatimonadaceae bacterium]